MIFRLFSVRDKAVGAFLPLFTCRSKGEAIRSFSQAVRDEKHQFSKHQEDYDLYDCGEWDDTSGVLSATPPVLVISAVEVWSSE